MQVAEDAHGRAMGRANPEPEEMQMPEMQMETQILMQSPADVVPVEVRLAFVKKVYAIVGMMLLVTVVVAASFQCLLPDTLNAKHCTKCFNSSQNETNMVAVDYSYGMTFKEPLPAHEKPRHCIRCWKAALSGTFVALAWIVIIGIPPITGLLAKCNLLVGVRQWFEHMMNTSPWNYTYLCIVGAVEGLFLSFILQNLSQRLQAIIPFIGVAMVLTLLGVTLFAAWTQKDFHWTHTFAVASTAGLITFGLRRFLENASPQDSVWTGLLTAWLAFNAIRETKAIFGVGSDPGRSTLTYDMYAFGAYEVFLTTVVFIGMGC